MTYYFKGRNFREQRISGFRGFWPFSQKFISTSFFEIAHSQMLNIGRPRKSLSAKY